MSLTDLHLTYILQTNSSETAQKAMKSDLIFKIRSLHSRYILDSFRKHVKQAAVNQPHGWSSTGKPATEPLGENAHVQAFILS